MEVRLHRITCGFRRDWFFGSALASELTRERRRPFPAAARNPVQDQEVEGSNPFAPAIFLQKILRDSCLLFLGFTHSRFSKELPS
jgi:hypothetical protein